MNGRTLSYHDREGSLLPQNRRRLLATKGSDFRQTESTYTVQVRDFLPRTEGCIPRTVAHIVRPEPVEWPLSGP